MKKNMLIVFVVMVLMFAVSGLAGSPSVSDVNLSFVDEVGVDYPDEDINVSGTTSDPDGDPVKLIYDWEKDGVSVSPLNMPFEGVTCAGCTSNTTDYGGVPQSTGAMNGPTWSKTGGVDSKGAYTLDGVNDFINVSHHNELNLTSSFSMELWVKPNVLSGYKALISKNINPRAASLWLNGNKVEVWWGNASGSMKLQSNGGLDTGRWTHLVATYESGTLKLYVNGVLNTSVSSVAVPPTNTNPITLGQRGDNSLYFNGTMDEVRLWKVALPADQVLDQYNKVTNILGKSLTESGNNWDAVVTPNDGFSNGLSQYPVVLQVPHMLSACKTSGWITDDAYQLSTNLVGVSGSCMVIDANGVTLNCGGPKNYIDGDDSAIDYGIHASTDYVTVKNCNVTDFNTGLYVTGDYGTFTNDILSSNVDGLKISGSTGSVADKIDVAVAAYNNTGDGISFVSSSYISGVNLDIESNLDDGISVDTSTDVNLSGGSYWNSDDGIYLTNSNTVDLHNFIVFANSGNGISGSSSDNVHVYNTTAPSYTSVMYHNAVGKAGILVSAGSDNWVVDKGVWLQSNSIALKYTSTGTGNTFRGVWFAPSNTLGIDVDGQNALFYENKIDGSGSANWVDCSNSNNAFDNGARGNVWGDYYKIEQYCNDGDHDNYCDDAYTTDGSAACTDNWPIQSEESATGCDGLLNQCKSSGWRGGTSGNRGIYCLGSDISNVAPASTCMGIDDDYVTLDCNRYNVAYSTVDGDDSGTDSGMSIAGAVTGVTVQDCNVTDFNSAVAYSSTGSSNTVSGTHLKSNVNGVEVSGSAANLAFSSNEVKSNTGSGAKYSATGTGNTFSSNTVQDNAKGAEVTSTGQNAVLHSNYFTANTVQAECANSNNAFDNNAVGNHWSDYDELSEGCYDENMNNFCDTARTIASASCTDDFPYQDVEHPNCDTLLSACKSSSWVNNAKYCLGSTVSTTGDCMVMGSTVSGVVLNCSGFGAAEIIQGDNVGVGDDGINIDRSDNIKIDHCRLQNFSKALQVTGSGADRTTNLAFLRNTVYVRDQNYGGYLDYTSNALFFMNDFLGAYQASGLTLNNENDNAVVEKNSFYQPEQGAIGLDVVATTNDNLIVNGSNTFDGRGSYPANGIRLTDADGAQVYGNVFRDFYGTFASGTSGVLLYGDADNNQIWNNDFVNATRGAIRWNGLSNGNVFDVNNQGNYWSDYDSVGEGCTDSEPDGDCDAAYDTGLLYGDPNPVVDSFPWTTAQN